jgi:hypothetical protein
MMTTTQHDDASQGQVPQTRYDDDMAPPSDPYASLRIRTEAVELLRRLVRQLSAEADRDITQSDAMTAAIRYALDHLPEVTGCLLASPHPQDTR